MARTSQREDIFYLPQTPAPGTGPLQTIPHPGPEGMDLSRELLGGGGGVGTVTGRIEPYITTRFLSEKELNRPILFKS